jgi:hypothetical protein
MLLPSEELSHKRHKKSVLFVFFVANPPSNQRCVFTPTRLQYSAILQFEQKGLIGLHRF